MIIQDDGMVYFARPMKDLSCHYADSPDLFYILHDDWDNVEPTIQINVSRPSSDGTRAVSIPFRAKDLPPLIEALQGVYTEYLKDVADKEKKEIEWKLKRIEEAKDKSD